MKNKKKLHGFSYTKNIANFEAFCWNILLSANLLFLKSETASFFPDCYKFDNNIVDQIVEMNDKLTSLKL